jgi:hypothetical protein
MMNYKKRETSLGTYFKKRDFDCFSGDMERVSGPVYFLGT